MHPYLVLMRVKSWKELSYFCLLGILVSKKFSLPPALIIYLAVCVASSSIFVINNIYDAPYDTSEEKKRKNPISSGLVKKKDALIFAALLFLISVILFSVFISMQYVLLLVGGMIGAYSYSIPPLRIKERPPFDILFHGIIPSISFFVPYVTFAPLSLDALLFTIAVVLLGSGMSVLHQLQDYDVDLRHNLLTSVLRHGKKRAAIAASLFFCCSILILLYLSLSGFVTIFLAPLILLVFYVPAKMLGARKKEDFMPLIFHLRRYINVIFIAIVLVLLADALKQIP